MTIRYFSSDSVRGAIRPPFQVGLTAALLLIGVSAAAQESPSPASPEAEVAPEEAPAPVPAPSPVETASTPAPLAPPPPLPSEPAPLPAPTAPASAAEDDDEQPHRRKAKHPGVRLRGRVLALAELSHRRETVVASDASLVDRDRDALDLSLQSARFFAEYQSPLPWLSAELELELAGKVSLKDAYLEAGKRFYARVGQFKIPAAALELVSPWKVPLARRGFVHDLLTDWMDVGGRLPGAELGYHGKGPLKPRLTAGVFQGRTLKEVVPGERDTRLIDHASLEAQTFAARAELSLFDVQVGAWYQQRVGSSGVGQFRHYATFGVDATMDQRLGPGALRFWLDGMGGQTFYVAGQASAGEQKPWFTAARALVGYRFGGSQGGDIYAEPFGFAAVLDPDTHITSDAATEAALGVAVGFWDRARLTLQVESTHAQRNFPSSLLENQEPDHRSALLQAGARF